jgi:LSD1 subclass zinc finger protein
MTVKPNENELELPEGSKDIRCIVCPTGCLVHIENVNGELIIEGHSCKRGEVYAKDEFIAPKRILTTTMRVERGFLPLIPVRSDQPIPKDKLRETLREIANTKIDAPIRMGDILIESVLGLNINIIASRDLIEIQ